MYYSFYFNAIEVFFIICERLFFLILSLVSNLCDLVYLNICEN